MRFSLWTVLETPPRCFAWLFWNLSVFIFEDKFWLKYTNDYKLEHHPAVMVKIPHSYEKEETPHSPVLSLIPKNTACLLLPPAGQHQNLLLHVRNPYTTTLFLGSLYIPRCP